MQLSPIEAKNKKKGRTISIIIHVLLLLFALFVTIDGLPRTPEPQYEVAVNFSFEPSSNSTKSTSSEGSEREKVDDVNDIEQQQAKDVEVETKTEVEQIEVVKTNPNPTDPIVSEVYDEDETDVVAVEEEVEIEDPEEDVVPDSEPSDSKPTKKIDVIEKVLKPSGSKGGGKKDGKDSADSSSSNSKDGNGSGKGTKGSGKGSDKTGDDNDSGKGSGGAGSGEYDGSGDGVFGRKVVHVERGYNFDMTDNAKMAVKICINRRGDVVGASIIEEETTVKDRATLKEVLRLIKKYKFEKDMTAPVEQCGKTSIKIGDLPKGQGQGLRFF